MPFYRKIKINVGFAGSPLVHDWHMLLRRSWVLAQAVSTLIWWLPNYNP